jgi:hypothetical protein
MAKASDPQIARTMLLILIGILFLITIFGKWGGKPKKTSVYEPELPGEVPNTTLATDKYIETNPEKKIEKNRSLIESQYAGESVEKMRAFLIVIFALLITTFISIRIVSSFRHRKKKIRKKK